jgi:hypothetical protein
MPVCRYHADRPGIGVCMRCRSVLCPACCTRVDGINHCHACLKKLAHRVTPSGKALGGRLASLAILMVGWLLLAGTLWVVQGRWAP